MKDQKLFAIWMIFTISLLTIAMLAACQSQGPSPAPTQSKQTSVTGSWTFVKESSSNPGYAEWGDDQGWHIRQHIEFGRFKTNDERLNGWSTGYSGFDYQFEPDGKTLIKMTSYGISTVSSDEAGKDILWLCSNNGSAESNGDGVANVVCMGRGKYQGLRAEYSLSGNADVGGDYTLNGLIFE